MFRKTILALIAAVALTAWVSAEPGTWGKEQPQKDSEVKAPKAMFKQWLHEFSIAYKQRDGEKMDGLLKQFDSAKQDFPAAPRMEKWMANVKEAYAAQDVQKMGGLLDNAQQMRDRMRERFGQNQNRQGRNEEGFGPQGRQMRGRDGDFRGRSFGQQRDMDARPEGQEQGRGFGRPERMRPEAQTRGNDRAFDGRGPRFNDRRPMESDMRPDGFNGGRFRGQMDFDRTAPRMRERFARPQFDGQRNNDRMAPSHRSFNDEADRPNYNNPAPYGRRDFDRRGFGPRMQRPQDGPRNDDASGDFRN